MQWLWASSEERFLLAPGQTDLFIGGAEPVIPVLYASTYTPEVSAQIHRAKYGKDWPSAVSLARAIRGVALPPDLTSAQTLLVPVPPDPRRLVTRGFHLPALLAKSLGRHWRVRVRLGGLTKTRTTPEQARRSRIARQQTTHGLFVSGRPLKTHNTHVLLVDDVMTTGATLRAAAYAVGQAGGRVLGAVVLAYVPAPDQRDQRPTAIRDETLPWHRNLWEHTEGVR